MEAQAASKRGGNDIGFGDAFGDAKRNATTMHAHKNYDNDDDDDAAAAAGKNDNNDNNDDGRMSGASRTMTRGDLLRQLGIEAQMIGLTDADLDDWQYN